MGFIRGKLESDRELPQPRMTYIGEPSFRQCFCGCEKWFDTKTGKQIEVVVQTFEEAFAELPLCNIEWK